MKTGEELRDRVRDDLKSRREQEENGQTREKVVEALLERVDFEVPQSAINSNLEPVLARMFQMEAYQKSMAGNKGDASEFDRDAIMESGKKEAEKMAKMHFILMKISEKEKIQITNEDLNREIMNMAYSSRMQPQDIVAMLQKDKNRLTGVQRDALVNKTLDFLAKEAKVNA